MSLSRLQWNLVHQAGRGLVLTAAQHCHPVMALSAGGEPTAIICIACVVDCGFTRGLNVTLVSGCLFMEVSIYVARGLQLARLQRPWCSAAGARGRRSAFFRKCEAALRRSTVSSASVSLCLLHITPGRTVSGSEATRSHSKCRHVAAICCTLESDLQLNSISSLSLCHSVGRGRKATIKHWSTTDLRGTWQARKVNASVRDFPPID